MKCTNALAAWSLDETATSTACSAAKAALSLRVHLRV
jgi:hypothetical protein